jgi:hypothetical protein
MADVSQADAAVTGKMTVEVKVTKRYLTPG